MLIEAKKSSHLTDNKFSIRQCFLSSKTSKDKAIILTVKLVSHSGTDLKALMLEFCRKMNTKLIWKQYRLKMKITKMKIKTIIKQW